MGLLTDFFVASSGELRSAMPGWLPIAPEPNRWVTNPITRERQLDWGPIENTESGQSTNALPFASFDVRRFPHAQWKRVEVVKLSRLQEILLGTDVRQAIFGMSKPALLHKEIDEQGVNALPEALVGALANIPDEHLGHVAERWSETDELAMDSFTSADAEEVLRSLVRLARLARSTDKQLYLWWSL